MRSIRSIKRFVKKNKNNTNVLKMIKIVSIFSLFFKIMFLGALHSNKDDFIGLTIKDALAAQDAQEAAASAASASEAPKQSKVFYPLSTLIMLFPAGIGDIFSIIVFMMLLTVYLHNGLTKIQKENLFKKAEYLMGFSIFVNIVFIILLYTSEDKILEILKN